MDFVIFLEKYSKVTPTIPAVIEIIKGDHNVVENLLNELDTAIDLFNNSSQFGKELINANKLKKIIGDEKLPSANSVWNDLFVDSMDKNDRLFKDFTSEFSRFKFIESMRNPQQLWGCLMVAIYRTYMLVRYPFLAKKKAQVASTIEEMLAIMALNGEKTYLFEATKHWIADWEREGFSKELAEKIKSIK